MKSEASITVRGITHLGWTDVAVNRSMEQLAHTFDIGFSEVWAANGKPLPIVEGDSCLVKLDDKDVINGYVDSASIDYDDTQHTMKVTGRSKTGDLVDCSAIYTKGKGQWRNQSLSQIAADLCQPFGITVSIQTDVGGPLRRFSIQDGETVHECLERACRIRGVLLMTTLSGELLITRLASKKTRTVLQFGENILRGSRQGQMNDRFSQYIVKAQVSGDNDFMGTAAATPKRESSDSSVKRYRPLIVQAESQEAGAELQKRADWERNVRAGRAQRLRYTVVGWENSEGLWEPNVLVRVVDQWLKVDNELLIISVSQTKSAEEGSVTELELSDPKSMSVEPLTPKPDKRSNFP